MDIILKNVDPDLLEEIRLKLPEVAETLHLSYETAEGELEAVNEMIAILDTWADQRHHDQVLQDEVSERQRLEALDIKAEMKRSLRGRG